MTLDQFLEVLERKSHGVEWYAAENGELRAGELRVGVPDGSGFSECHCPITFVLLRTTGEFRDMSDWECAARLLGLCRRDAQEIVWNADNEAGSVGPLRARLLEACGVA